MPYKDPEKQRDADRRWRKANPEKVREASRRWRTANPEKQREATEAVRKLGERFRMAARSENFLDFSRSARR
jgi:hypothetical protein